jgi:predicted permease
MITTIGRTIRQLRRSPAFAAVATLSLAVGLGLSAATFAMVDSMLHPKIPIADVDRLFRANLRFGNQKHPPSILEQVRALELLPGVERVTAIAGYSERVRADVDGVESYPTFARTTPDFFATIGVAPRLGRLPNNDEIGARSAVVLSASAWKKLFPKQTTLDGASIKTDDRTYSVVGVLAPGFETLLYSDIWLPATSLVDLEGSRNARIIAKLRMGVDSLSIRPQLATIAANFTERYAPPPAPAYVIELHGMRPKPVNLRDNELMLLMVGIAVGVLAIACTNVSALALARGLSRRRDFALRVALGSSRLAIGGEVLTEVAVLGAIGAVIGFMFATALVGVLTHLVPEDLTLRGFLIPELTGRVFVLTSLTLVAGILIAGGVPAWRASRANLADPLKDNAGTTTGRSRTEFKVLVMGELAIAMALLMLASLMTLSTRNILNFDFGFDARRLLEAYVYLPSGRDSLTAPQREAVVQASIQRIAEMQEVAAVSTHGWGPFEDERITSDAGRDAEPLRLRGGYIVAGANFFSTIGAQLLEGRDFAAGDRTRGAVILSKRAASLLYPHGGALGRMVKLGGERSNRPWMQVIGIAPDIRLGFSPDPASTLDTVVYATANGSPPNFSEVVIRPKIGNPTLSVSILHAMRDGLPPRASSHVEPFVRHFDELLRYREFYRQIFSFLSVASLLLGATGLFSVMSYSVGQRLREFAVRQALGASPRDVLRLVMRGAFELALGGTAFGALLSFWASAGVSTQLFGVKNTDPVALIVAELTLLAVTMVASLVPALRAMRADPVDVLRST